MSVIPEILRNATLAFITATSPMEEETGPEYEAQPVYEISKLSRQYEGWQEIVTLYPDTEAELKNRIRAVFEAMENELNHIDTPLSQEETDLVKPLQLRMQVLNDVMSQHIDLAMLHIDQLKTLAWQVRDLVGIGPAQNSSEQTRDVIGKHISSLPEDPIFEATIELDQIQENLIDIWRPFIAYEHI